MCATYVLNRTRTRTLVGKTPFEAWHQVKPSVAHLRVFGCDAYVHVPKVLRKKLEPKSRKGFMMGYSETSKAYRIWDIDSRKIVEARDVLFNEDSFFCSTSTNVDCIAAYEHEWIPLGSIAENVPPIAVGVGVPPLAVGAGAPLFVMGAGPSAALPDEFEAPDPPSHSTDDDSTHSTGLAVATWESSVEVEANVSGHDEPLSDNDTVPVSLVCPAIRPPVPLP